MSDQHEHLPALIEQNPEVASMGEMIGISDESLSLTLLGAQPAFEYAQLLEVKEGKELWFMTPTYPEPSKSRLIHRKSGPHYERKVEDSAYLSETSFTADGVWAVNEHGLWVKLDQRRQFEVAKAALVESHPLGKGGLITANEFGGIDYEHPEETARHLVLRAIIDKELKERLAKRDAQQAVKVDLLHPAISQVMGSDFVRLIDGMGKIVDSVAVLPESSKKQTGPVLLESAIEQGRVFIADHQDEVAMVAVAVHNPEKTIRIARAVESERRADKKPAWQSMLGQLAVEKGKE